MHIHANILSVFHRELLLRAFSEHILNRNHEPLKLRAKRAVANPPSIADEHSSPSSLWHLSPSVILRSKHSQPPSQKGALFYNAFTPGVVPFTARHIFR